MVRDPDVEVIAVGGGVAGATASTLKPDIDFGRSVVDWVIDYPSSIAVFKAYGIDCCCPGKSLRYACLEVDADLPTVAAALDRALTNRGFPTTHTEEDAPRPFSYWVERSPPGWISNDSATAADPVALANQIQALATAFLEWLNLPAQRRWDTFVLQSLSAALFNRYQIGPPSGPKESAAPIELLQLKWPSGSDEIRCRLRELQQLLVEPFAVFKALRIGLASADYPTLEEIGLAETALKSGRGDLENVVCQLRSALHEYTRANHNAPSTPLVQGSDYG